jgi:hypothetical protein
MAECHYGPGPHPDKKRCERLRLALTQVGSPYSVSVWLDDDGRMRIENLGPFKAGAARRLARWILATFGEAK